MVGQWGKGVIGVFVLLEVSAKYNLILGFKKKVSYRK